MRILRIGSMGRATSLSWAINGKLEDGAGLALKLAIVVPWFGRDLKGGAEQHAWQIASRLARRGHEVEVLTTCCRAHQDDWNTNHLPAGSTKEVEGFTTRRFL